MAKVRKVRTQQILRMLINRRKPRRRRLRSIHPRKLFSAAASGTSGHCYATSGPYYYNLFIEKQHICISHEALCRVMMSMPVLVALLLGKQLGPYNQNSLQQLQLEQALCSVAQTQDDTQCLTLDDCYSISADFIYMIISLFPKHPYTQAMLISKLREKLVDSGRKNVVAWDKFERELYTVGGCDPIEVAMHDLEIELAMNPCCPEDQWLQQSGDDCMFIPILLNYNVSSNVCQGRLELIRFQSEGWMISHTQQITANDYVQTLLWLRKHRRGELVDNV